MTIEDFAEAHKDLHRVADHEPKSGPLWHCDKCAPNNYTLSSPAHLCWRCKEIAVSRSRAPQEPTTEEREMARGFISLWDSIDVQDADDWLYVLRNRAELLLAPAVASPPAPEGEKPPMTVPDQLHRTMASGAMAMIHGDAWQQCENDLAAEQSLRQAAEAALALQAQERQWQLIDGSTPKDTRILLGARGKRTGKWLVDCGAYSTSEAEWEYWRWTEQEPTHWMPLPSLPSAAAPVKAK